MRSFLFWAIGVTLAAVGVAALVTLTPLAHVAAAAGGLLAVVVFAAARSGSPRWFGLRHLFGLLFAAIAVIAHWTALLGFAEGASLAAFDAEAAGSALIAPLEWPARVQALADTTSYAAGGRMITGGALAAAWAVEAGIIALFGLLGGHSAYWRPQPRL